MEALHIIALHRALGDRLEEGVPLPPRGTTQIANHTISTIAWIWKMQVPGPRRTVSYIRPLSRCIGHGGGCGMAAGWIYYRYLHELRWQLPSRRAEIELPSWLKKSAKSPVPPAYTVNVSSPGDLRAEVDRILDKINKQEAAGGKSG